MLQEHYSLDLSQFNGFTSTAGQTGIQWKTLSINLTQGGNLPSFQIDTSAPIQSNRSYVLYGTIRNETNNTIENQFYNYHPEVNKWSSLPIMSNFSQINIGSIVNMGNDNLWIWGGSSSNSTTQSSSSSNILGIFNYNGLIWTSQNSFDWQVRIGHSATLARNGIIYIIGGSIGDDQISNLVNFTDIITYNTQSSQWTNVTADIVGRLPSGRAYHTTTTVPDKDLLLIYGGNNLNYSVSDSMQKDVFYLYDTKNNKLSYVIMPSDYLNARHGHFATIYNYNYLVLLFGFSDEQTGAANINVLNIANLNSPYWVIPPPRYSKNSSGEDEHGKNTVIKMITIVTVVIMGVIICILSFIMYQRNKQKKAMRTAQKYVQTMFDIKNNSSVKPC
ncbi:unnamed protein product [Cunninghamella echinulata]